MNALVETMLAHIPRRDGERGFADVAGPHLDIRSVVSERDRDAAAAGANVSCAQGSGGVTRDRHRALYEHFCVGVWHQHVGRDLKVEGHELLVTDQVSDRLAARTPRDQLAITSQLR